MIIFDLDGTLWDSGQSVAESWNIETARNGAEYHFKAEDIQGVMGLTMNEIADHLMPDLPESERYPLIRKCEKYEIEYIYENGGVLFPGVRETLAKLQEDGHKLTIVSNCQAGYVEAFLHSMKMDEYFCDYEEWGRTHLSKSENIRLVMERNGEEHAIYVGDIQRDADSAAEAGIACIAAEYGFGHIQDPIARIYEFGELIECLKKIEF